MRALADSQLKLLCLLKKQKQAANVCYFIMSSNNWNGWLLLYCIQDLIQRMY